MSRVTDGAADLLREELASLRFPLDAATQDRLRQYVCDYVDELRDRGWPPERTIVAVKTLAHEAGLRASQPLLSRDATIMAADELLAHLVSWCIERYYFR